MDNSRLKLICFFSRKLHSGSFNGLSDILKRKISQEKLSRKKYSIKNQVFPESKKYLDTATLPMILTGVGITLFAKVLVMVDDSKSQETIERKIKNAPDGQELLGCLVERNVRRLKMSDLQPPLSLSFLVLMQGFEQGNHMEDLKDWTVDVLTDAFTRVEDNLRHMSE